MQVSEELPLFIVGALKGIAIGCPRSWILSFYGYEPRETGSAGILFLKKVIAMKNPWTKKNPWMSMYLSGANAVAGSIRGSATAAAKRQATSSINSGIKQVTNAWASAFLPASPRSRKGRQR